VGSQVVDTEHGVTFKAFEAFKRYLLEKMHTFAVAILHFHCTAQQFCVAGD